MRINKKIDFSGNIDLLIDIEKNLKGMLNPDLRKLSFLLNTKEKSINKFIQDIIVNLKIKESINKLEIKHNNEILKVTASFGLVNLKRHEEAISQELGVKNILDLIQNSDSEKH